MQIFQTIEAARIVFVTGILNFIIGFIIFGSCRWIPLSRFFKNWMKSRLFQRIYKYHTYLWWVFWISVGVHIVFAIGRLGLPF